MTNTPGFSESLSSGQYNHDDEQIVSSLRLAFPDQFAQASLADRVSKISGKVPDFKTLRAQCPNVFELFWPYEVKAVVGSTLIVQEAPNTPYAVPPEPTWFAPDIFRDDDAASQPTPVRYRPPVLPESNAQGEEQQVYDVGLEAEERITTVIRPATQRWNSTK